MGTGAVMEKLIEALKEAGVTFTVDTDVQSGYTDIIVPSTASDTTFTFTFVDGNYKYSS